MQPNHGLSGPQRPRFEVSIAPGLLDQPRDGRILVVLSTRTDLEPRHQIGILGPNAPIIFGRDTVRFGRGTTVTLDDHAAFPHPAPNGEFLAQAIFDHNRSIRMPHAALNLHSEPVLVEIRSGDGNHRLELSQTIPPEQPPENRKQVRYLKLQSPRLSAFHGRSIFVRAGVILPRDYDLESDRTYPLRVSIGGYGSRYTIIERLMATGTGFEAAWNAEDTPRMILLRLDGAGPLGDPHQVNSANHGPYGDAVVHELIPAVERAFRAVGSGPARFLEGVSTGGWAALALQIFYPDEFGGAWACCPDSVDFRAFETIDIYSDDNAYLDPAGNERPASRDLSGAVMTTMRHECALENAIGRRDSWTLSGGQWGAWNATFSPRNADGLPAALWDAKTGAIDRAVAESWKQFDLRLVLERGWTTLGPKLRGKLHISSGESDEYFLNGAVHRLESFLTTVSPTYGGSIVFGPGKGHGWSHLDEQMLAREMTARCLPT